MMIKKLLVLVLFTVMHNVNGVEIHFPSPYLNYLVNTYRSLESSYRSLKSQSHEYWDWSKINTNDVTFPQGFLFGVGTSSYQVEGGNDEGSVWLDWYKSGKVSELAGAACDHWNRYKEDVQLIKNLGANTYRFGIEWSRVEPQPGQFDEQALNHYEALCDELLANGIAPIVTLHHYNDPRWFAALGGFEQQENCFYYVRFAKKVVERLHNKVHLWLTFNSPTSYAAKGYLQAMMPPGKKDMQLMAEVLANILDAHVQLYKTVKAEVALAHVRIGILHNIFQLDPDRWWNPIDQMGCLIGSYLTHTCLYKFFTTGVFKIYIPFKVNVYRENSSAASSLDFIGLNYYSHGMMHEIKPKKNENEIDTTHPQHTIYPEGFYRAVKELWSNVAHPLHIPIYVTENGCSPRNEEHRDLHLRRYLYALSRAISEGCDVRGYCYWSLMDNYEWGTKTEHRFGLYSVDFTTFERTLRQSAAYFITVAKKFAKPFDRYACA